MKSTSDKIACCSVVFFAVKSIVAPLLSSSYFALFRVTAILSTRLFSTSCLQEFDELCMLLLYGDIQRCAPALGNRGHISMSLQQYASNIYITLLSSQDQRCHSIFIVLVGVSLRR